MALPGNVGSGTVTGRLIDSLGNPIEGKVTFTPSPAALLNASAEPSPVTIIPKPVVVTLSDGSFTTTLTATDDPDNNPTGWTYKVDFSLQGAKRSSFSIEVPEGETVDLTTVAPVSSKGGVTITRGPGVPEGGSTGQVLAKKSGDDFDTQWITVSGGGGEGGPVYWDDVLNKPSTFTPSSHTHAIADVTGLQSALNGKAGTGDLFSGSYDDLTDKPDIPETAADVGALADDYEPEVADLLRILTGDIAGLYVAIGVKHNGTSWPTIPTSLVESSKTQFIFTDFSGTAGAPSQGREGRDIVLRDTSA